MKRIFKITIINIILLLIVFLSVEFYCYYKHYYNSTCDNIKIFFNTYKYFYTKYSDIDDEISKLSDGYFLKYVFREINYEEYPNPAIILLGCSFTHGSTLSEEESFHSILANTIKHPVYNLGVSSGSPREMLYILRNKKLLDYLTNNNKDINYVIYTYIEDHLTRLIYDLYIVSPYYILDNNHSKLIYKEKNKFINASYIYKYIESRNVYSTEHKQKNIDLFYIYMKEIKQEINKQYKNAKFVIFVFDDEGTINWKLLENMGITIVKVTDIFDENIRTRKYFVSDTDTHPNALVWEVLVPRLVKALNLK